MKRTAAGYSMRHVCQSCEMETGAGGKRSEMHGSRVWSSRLWSLAFWSPGVLAQWSTINIFTKLNIPSVVHHLCKSQVQRAVPGREGLRVRPQLHETRGRPPCWGMRLLQSTRAADPHQSAHQIQTARKRRARSRCHPRRIPKATSKTRERRRHRRRVRPHGGPDSDVKCTQTAVGVRVTRWAHATATFPGR